MNNFFVLLDKYKFGLLAVFMVYILLFIYLQMTSYTHYFPIERFNDGPRIELPKDEIALKAENIEFNSAVSDNVSNSVRDQNDKRKKSLDNWSENESASQAEQSVKDFEKQILAESGGEAQRKKIQQDMDERAKKKSTDDSKIKDNTSKSGGETAFAGDVMVDFALANRSPHMNNRWHIRNPGYTCGHGSRGKIIVQIKVNQNGDVVQASIASSTSSNACMLEQALKYAKMSRFNFADKAPKFQEGQIVYTFISQ
jgi:outer membrane biosynthesis protein TonB